MALARRTALDRRRMARTCRAARSSPTSFMSRLSRLPPPRCSAASAGAVLVWSGTAPRKLLGFFPARIEARRYGFRLPVLVGWTHPYAPLGTPLVEREAAEPVIAAWLAHIADNPALPGFVLLPLCPAESARSPRHSHTILQRTQMPAADFDLHERAMLAPRGDRCCMSSARSGSTSTRRLRRKCGGWPMSARCCSRPRQSRKRSRRLSKIFLSWKQAAGKVKPATAAAYHDDVRSFMKTAVTGPGGGRQSRDQPHPHRRPCRSPPRSRCAAATPPGSGRPLMTRSFAHYSPGVLLTLALTEDLVEDATIATHRFLRHCRTIR